MTHRTNWVEVPIPGIHGAEGKEKGKGLIVRWGLEEARSKSARRRAGTEFGVWYARGEWAPDHKALYPLSPLAIATFITQERPVDISFLLRGLIIGFSIAAPVGPIGVLCIRRTLAEGRASGIVSGLGAATADAIYGCIAGFGLTFISSILISQQVWLHVVGGVVLCYLGLKTFLSRPAEQTAPVTGNGIVGAYASTFFLTLANPMTILSFAAIFAGLGVASTSGSYGSAGVLVLGVFCGSAFWWLLLSGGVGVFRAKFNTHGLQWVNRISGIIITAFGLFALLSLR